MQRSRESHLGKGDGMMRSGRRRGIKRRKMRCQLEPRVSPIALDLVGKSSYFITSIRLSYLLCGPYNEYRLGNLARSLINDVGGHFHLAVKLASEESSLSGDILR